MSKRQIQASFRSFIDEFSAERAPAAHHRLLIEKLEAVERGEINRLMVFMPPGSAKSFYANVMFSAWYMGRNPGKKLITASYSQEVADKWGRRVRGIIRDERYAQNFDAQLSQDSQAAGRWALSTESEYYAVGVGGSVTSFRADLGIIDDPVKGREEADSDTVRAKTNEWYQSDFWTRLKPGAAVIIIMTRWQEEDLAGFLLDEMQHGGEQWEVLKLPMIAEQDDPLGRLPGQRLWAEYFTDHMVEQAQRNSRNWSALYQQRPSPEEGAYFKREWFRYYDTPPAHVHKYGASDYAVTDNGGDYTVHGVMGVDPEDNIYLLDWWRDQTESDVWIERFLDMVALHKPMAWAEESGQILKSLGPFIAKRQRERKVWCYRKQFTSASDKATRAQSFRARASMGMVYLPRNAPWVEPLLYELTTFPAGKYDDSVDVCSLMGRMLDMTVKGEMPIPKDPSINTHGPTFNELLAEAKRNNKQRTRI